MKTLFRHCKFVNGRLVNRELINNKLINCGFTKYQFVNREFGKLTNGGFVIRVLINCFNCMSINRVLPNLLQLGSGQEKISLAVFQVGKCHFPFSLNMNEVANAII